MTNETAAGEASGASGAGTLNEEDAFIIEEPVPQHGVLGFTVRELLIVIVWLAAFVCSFFPTQFIGPGSIWTADLSWLLTIGVPTLAVFLLVLRRFSPDGIRRVGSLGIDQFASVAFSVAALYWLQTVWSMVMAQVAFGELGVLPWVIWVEFICMVVLVVLTVCAPIIPGIREDFRQRIDTLAHRVANPARPVVARPKPVVAEPEATSRAQDRDTHAQDDSDTDDSDDAQEDHLAAAGHVSGGSTGTMPIVDDDYSPAYARSSNAANDEVDDAGEAGVAAKKA